MIYNFWRSVRWLLVAISIILVTSMIYFHGNGLVLTSRNYSYNQRINNLQCDTMKLKQQSARNLPELMEHKMNSIPGTTGPGIPHKIRKILNSSYGGVTENATDFYGAAQGKPSVLYRISY